MEFVKGQTLSAVVKAEGKLDVDVADADQPSKVTIDNGDGVILEEHLLGRDLSQEMEN